MSDLLSRIAALPPDKREILLQQIKQKKAVQSNTEQMSRQKRGSGPFPMSFAQQRLWVYDQLEPGSFRYNVPEAVRIQGPLNIAALEQSLNEVVRRHESWRTRFTAVDGEPVQMIAPALDVRIPVIDLRRFPESERQQIAEQMLIEDGKRPFDLAKLPLFRPLILWTGEQDYIFLLTNHHIISDRWSRNLIIQELISHYETLSQGKSVSLPEPDYQYVDFAIWQRGYLKGEVLEKQVSYWKQQLGGEPPVLDLPTDRPRPPEQTYRGGTRIFRLPRSLADELKQLCREENVTLFMVMLAALDTLLYRYSGQEDLIVGVPIANRNKPEIERVIGFFVNALALRTKLSAELTFRDLLERVRKATLDGYAHQDLPFEKVVEELQLERDTSRNPLFQVCLTLQNVPLPPLKMSDLTIKLLELDWGMTRFDMTLFVWETLEVESPEAGLTTLYSYNADLFDAETIERMAGHFRTLLEGIVADPNQRVSTLPILTRAERDQILAKWNDTALDVARDVCAHQLFEAQVERTPAALAVFFQGQQLTYRELNCRANQLAHHLRKIGVGPEAPVGVSLERSMEMMVAVLGIIKAGGAYVPLDPSYPKERLAFMMEDAKAPVLVTQQKLLAGLPDHQARAVLIDSDWESIAAESDENPVNISHAENMIYVIYTSGSTGKPKGVMIQHRSFVNLGAGLHEAVYSKLPPALRVSLNAPLAFDASVKQWIQLLYGHSIFVFPEEVRLDGNELVSYVARHKLDVLDVTPSLLRVLLKAGLSASPETSPRVALIGGEAVDDVTWATLASNQWTNFVNMYGPTECTDDTTLIPVRTHPDRPTIGRQIANIHLYILDKRLNPVPVGVPGELCIGGASPGRGYLNRPDATAEKYIPDPFSAEPGARMYRTGDLIRWLADGLMEFVARVDHQVKIRGFRIELGEIESVLAQNQSVREAVVTAREDTPGDKRLVAYIVPRDQGAADAVELREYLKQRLPDYMVPSAFVMMEALPLTPNKKVDLKALPAPEVGRPAMKQEYVAPRNQLERELAEIWAQVLNVERIGIRDNFFELGGHSLLAIQLILKVRQKFGADLLLTTMFKAPTVADLAALLSEQSQDEREFSALVPIQPAGTRPPLFCAHPAGGQAMVYQHLAALLGDDQPVFGLQSRGLSDPGREHKSIDEMAIEYASFIRERQPSGPYHLIGWSMGGVIALSIARELERQAEEVAFVGLIDSYLFTEEAAKQERDPLLGVALAFGGALASAFNALDAAAQQSLRDELLSLADDARIRRVIEWGTERDLLPAELSPEMLQAQVSLAEIHDELLRGHRAPTIKAPVRVWWARDKAEGGLPRADWSKHTDGQFDSQVVDGNHFTIVQPPLCRAIAEGIEEALSEVVR